MAVAADARVRGLPRLVARQPRLDHPGAELRAQVEREVRHPHPVGERARDAHRVRRAARRLGVVGLVGPQLERHRDRALAGEQRGHRRVHPAAHRHERAALVERDRSAGSRGEPERAVQRVGGQVCRVQLARREPAELVGDRARPDARGIEHRRARHERHRRRSRGDHRAAAGSLEAGLGHPRAVDPDPDGHQVTARGAAGRSHGSAGGHVPLPLREIQMLGEALGAHAPSVGAARSSSGRARRSCARTSCRGACRPPSRS